MFVDFDEVFNSKPESQAKIPDALVQYLSNQLPSGFKYVPDENGNYIVTSDNSDLKIGGLVFKPTAEERKTRKEFYTG